MHSGRVLEEVKTPIRSVRPGRVLMWAGLTLLAFAYLVGIFGPLPDLSTSEAKPPTKPAPAAPIPDGEQPAAPGDNPPPAVAEAKRKTVAEVLSMPPGKFPDYLKLTDYAQEAYDYVYKLPNLNFYIMAVLLVITLLSVFLNRPTILRSRRKGKAMMLPSLPV